MYYLIMPVFCVSNRAIILFLTTNDFLRGTGISSSSIIQTVLKMYQHSIIVMSLIKYFQSSDIILNVESSGLHSVYIVSRIKKNFFLVTDIPSFPVLLLIARVKFLL